MKLEALRDYIVVRPILAQRKVSSGGIAMPDQCQERYEDGVEIVSIGPKVEGLAVGQIVVRPDPPRYVMTDDDTNEEFWICAEEDIAARIL